MTYKGGQILNLFDKFGTAPPAEIDFDLDFYTNPGSPPIDGVLRRKCAGLIRKVRAALGAGAFDYLHAFCGDDFFDDLLQHPEVRGPYRGWSDDRILRESYVGKNRSTNPIFEFGGIVWENYGPVDGSGDGALLGIDTNKVRFVPVGSPKLFRTYHAPADYNETVNTPGLPRYAKSWPMQNDKGLHGEVQMNSLSICTRPGALFSGRRT